MSDEQWQAELARRRLRIAQLHKDFDERLNDRAFRLLNHVDFGAYCELRTLCGPDVSGPCTVEVRE